MTFHATPFAHNDLGRIAKADALFPTPDNHYVGDLSEYDERQTVQVNADDANDALSAVFLRFQNLSESRQAPDAGRSLMTSDLIRLRSGDDESWWICCSFGWHQIEAPANAAAPDVAAAA